MVFITRFTTEGTNPANDSIPVPINGVCASNTTETVLSANTWFTGSFVDVSMYGSVSVLCVGTAASTAPGTLYIDSANDALTNITSDVTEIDDIGQARTVTHAINAAFVRVRYLNGSQALLTTNITTMLHTTVLQPTSRADVNLPAETEMTSVRTIMSAQIHSSGFANLRATATRNLAVAIREPRMPFGSIHTERKTTVLRSNALYGIDTREIFINTQGSGTVTGANNMIVCNAGTDASAFADVQSRQRVVYRPGQGSIMQFTAVFGTPISGTVQKVGCGTSESGMYFGYNDNTFSIFYETGGICEIRTLTISSPSANTNGYTITLDGTSVFIASTNASSSTTRTAYEIALGTFPGWRAEARGSTVVFVANDAGARNGAYSLVTTSGAAGTFASTRAGTATTVTTVPQTSWNVDVMDGSRGANNNSGCLLVPGNGNIYQISMQYLGFGTLAYAIEVSDDDGTAFVPVHEVRFPNTSPTVNIIQPTLPFSMSARITGGAIGSDLVLSVPSYVGCIEGERSFDNHLTIHRETNGLVTTSYFPIFTFRNSIAFGLGATPVRANQQVFSIVSINVSHDDNTPISFFLFRTATVTGPTNFIQLDAQAPIWYDTASTGMTIVSATKLELTLNCARNTSHALTLPHFIDMQPGDSYTLAARTSSGTATYVTASLNIVQNT